MTTAVKLTATPGRMLPDGTLTCHNCGAALESPANVLHKITQSEICKNLCGKEVKGAWRMPDEQLFQAAHEVWRAGTWTWYVLKKWQTDDNKPYARWFCLVKTPMAPDGDMGDTYAAEIRSVAVRVK